MSPQPATFTKSISLGFALVVVGLVAAFMFDRSMRRSLDHDEHQFVASGAMLVDGGLLPYSDYPYFHLPNLAFLYAAAFLLSPYRLLTARALAVAASTGIAAILVLSGVCRFPRPMLGLLAGVGLVGLLYLDPVFRFTTGLAWNHDVPVFLFLLGLILGWAAPARRVRRPWFVLAGVALGFVAGTRASFLLALCPALAFILAGSAPASRRRDLLLLLLGIAIGLLPTIVSCGLGPKSCFFGNLTYAGLNTRYRIEYAPEATMTLPDKVSYLAQLLTQPTTLALCSLMLVTWVGVLRLAWVDSPHLRVRSLWAGAIVIVLLAAGLLPTPSWPQYYFAPLVIGTVLGFWGAAELLRGGHGQVLLAVVALSAYAIVRSGPAIFQPDAWQRSLSAGLRDYVPLQVRQTSSRIHNEAGDRPVLTLSPIYVIETGGSLLPSFITGPFAFRTAYLVPASERASLGLIAAADLAEYLTSHPMTAVLVGDEEPRLEQAIINQARSLGYRMLPIDDRLRLWLPPEESIADDATTTRQIDS